MIPYTMDFFEGTEKKLEIILDRPVEGFRSNDDGRWTRIVEASGAEMLHRSASLQMDAYLLSESSLFVWNDRMLIITCGRTTPAAAMPLIVDCVGAERVGFLFFERKNAFHPEAQPTDFEADVARIRDVFPGRSMRLGHPEADHIHLFWWAGRTQPRMPDATFQVLMHGLSPVAEADFTPHPSDSPVEGSRPGRLRRLYPSTSTDDFFFSPQGYSLNGLRGDGYFTVHVTPQPACSYASFETNMMDEDFSRVLAELIHVFDPRRFSVMLTTSNGPETAALHERLQEIQDSYAVQTSVERAVDPHYRAAFFNCLRPGPTHPDSGREPAVTIAGGGTER